MKFSVLGQRLFRSFSCLLNDDNVLYLYHLYSEMKGIKVNEIKSPFSAYINKIITNMNDFYVLQP